ncbi:MAG: hypothetical protein HY810_03585 [Candidatus Omnitrophica bacterium]|nr:hypothetical protein [Candidatus Omnitrophota bacterium]
MDGKRQKPIWAIGGSAFDYDGDFKERCKDLVNMVIADKVNEADILEAIRKGKVYVNRGKEAHNFILEDFSVYNGAGKKTMGEQIVIEEQFPIIKIKAGFRNAENLKLKINVIKNGKVIKKIENDAPIEEAFTDDSENDLKQSYYRLEIKAEGLHVISNPVFVERQGIGNRE